MSRIGLVCLSAALASVVVGCGPQSMPKGAGASGRLAGDAKKADLGLAQINKLDEDQQRAFDYLHQSFEEATIPGSGADGPNGKVVDGVKKAWDDGDYVKVPEGIRVTHFASIVTDVGKLVLRFDPEMSPNHVRSFLSLANSGFFDGMELSFSDGSALFGTEPNEDLYFLEHDEHDARSVWSALYVVAAENGMFSGSRFGIKFHDDAIAARHKYIAGLADGSEIDEIAKLLDACAKGPVVIRKIEATKDEPSLSLYGDEGDVKLPIVEPDGTVTPSPL